MALRSDDAWHSQIFSHPGTMYVLKTEWLRHPSHACAVEGKVGRKIGKPSWTQLNSQEGLLQRTLHVKVGIRKRNPLRLSIFTRKTLSMSRLEASETSNCKFKTTFLLKYCLKKKKSLCCQYACLLQLIRKGDGSQSAPKIRGRPFLNELFY